MTTDSFLTFMIGGMIALFFGMTSQYNRGPASAWSGHGAGCLPTSATREAPAAEARPRDR